MRLLRFNLLHMRHGPKPKPAPRALPGRAPAKTPTPLRTIIVEAVAEVDGRTVSGFGEVRPSSERYGEGAKEAATLAPMLASRLLGVELDHAADRSALLDTAASIVTTATREALSVPGAPLGRSHTATRFAFETALLDLAARASDRSLRTLLGGTDAPLRITVRNYKMDRPEELLGQLIGPRRRQGWVRFSGRPDMNGDLSAINVATAGLTAGADQAGVWLNAGGTWNSLRMEQFLASVRQLPQFRAGVPLIIEEPFPQRGYDEMLHYVERLEAWRSAGELNVRLLLSTWIESASSVGLYKALLPLIDLGLSPHRIGGVADVFNILDAARASGFGGQVYFEGAGASTDINTVMLATLTSAVPEARYYSALPAGPTQYPILSTRPKLTADEAELELPEGPGLGLSLQFETLPNRLQELQIATAAGLESGPAARERYMLENAPLQAAVEDATGPSEQSDDDWDGGGSEGEDEAERDAWSASG